MNQELLLLTMSIVVVVIHGLGILSVFYAIMYTRTS